MNKKYAIELSYHGKNYHGWQIQVNAKTIQEELEYALSTIIRARIHLTGAGRTDTGVHASYYVAHFLTDAEFDPADIAFKLNSFLPESIAIFSVKKVDSDFHARFKAVSRTYKYLLYKKKSAFLSELAYVYTAGLDIQKMNSAATTLLKHTDFSSFAKLHSDNKTNNCSISHAEWHSYGDFIIFTITADRFLRNMVRAISGTLIDIGKGSVNLEEFEDIIRSKDNQRDRCRLRHRVFTWLI